MKPIKFHPDAESEMRNSASFYEEQQQDLGKRFLSVIQNSLNQIQINPELFPIVHIGVRRCVTKTFPFNVLFRITPKHIIIVAIMHQRRHPDYWKTR